MRRTPIIAAVTVVALGIGARVGFGRAGDLAAASLPKKAQSIKPPVITESFTLLPCHVDSTIGMEGCEEHKLVAADERIDRDVSRLFSILYDNAARRHLIQAQTAWFAYRQADTRRPGRHL